MPAVIQEEPLPDPEYLAPAVHQVWLQQLKLAGVTSRRAHWGEELAVEWPQLSPRAQLYNVDMVRLVLFMADMLSPRIRLAD